MFNGDSKNGEKHEFIPLDIPADLTFNSFSVALGRQMELFSQGSGLVLAVCPRDFARALELLAMLPPGNISIAALPCFAFDSWALIGTKGTIYSPGG